MQGLSGSQDGGFGGILPVLATDYRIIYIHENNSITVVQLGYIPCNYVAIYVCLVALRPIYIWA